MPTKIQPAVVYDADGIALKGAHEVLVENCLVERCDLLGEPFLSCHSYRCWQWSLQLLLLKSTTSKTQGTAFVPVLLEWGFEALTPKAQPT